MRLFLKLFEIESNETYLKRLLTSEKVKQILNRMIDKRKIEKILQITQLFIAIS
jgi:hypothetical protein